MMDSQHLYPQPCLHLQPESHHGREETIDKVIVSVISLVHALSIFKVIRLDPIIPESLIAFQMCFLIESATVSLGHLAL